jgi:protein-S-isoprenylcysteine O-methyltransferase Ste14
MSNIAAILDARVPPPVVMLVAGMLAWVGSVVLPAAYVAFAGSSLVAVTAVSAGLVLNLYPKLLFRRVRTTVNPLKPYASSALLTNGIYRHSRNPMYLGHALILLGLASHLENWVSLLSVPAYLAYVTQFQVKPEERALMASFPEQFAKYAQSTRRWA